MNKIHFNRSQLGKLKRLLDMEYRPSEIASEIGLTADTLYRSHIPNGAPARTDKTDRIWINGKLYAAWVHDYQIQRKSRLDDHCVMTTNETYCFTCNKVVAIVTPKIRKYKRNIVLKTGRCPECGGKVSRFLPEGTEPLT